ncbi:hypothetical protein FNAPI_4643 [Fusarium napiforme]|uniref:Uncharacterized protein n=1 Tax=Fusarium napiforme TaxID=42672 RepID=A0A8H5NBA4_9HYPO|nr:hypothetical protein FNAPI_4643 [Fusarium napiforme]
MRRCGRGILELLMAGKSESGTIKYEEVPDRWLIFRHIDKSQPSMPALEIFLVESNKIRKVNDLFKAEQDLETNSSPFLVPKLPPEDQLSTVMGKVSRLTPDWKPDGKDQDFHCAFTVMGSGNPLFADYMPHNAAVFSLHKDPTSAVQGPGSIESAKVSYAVYGFFANDNSSKDALRICYGTLYSVDYRREHRPSLIEAEGIATSFARLQPLAVGEDVLDECVVMFQGSGNVQESAVSEVLQQLKVAASLSGSTSQLDRASISSGSFTSSHGGYHWRVKKKEDRDDMYGGLKPPKAQGDDALTDDQIQALQQLNEAQDYLDSLPRRQRYLRHLIFCEWWKHCIVVDNDELLAQQRRTHAIAKAQRLLKRIEMVKSLVVAAERLVLRTILYGIIPGSDLSKLESSPRSFSGKSLIRPDAQKTLQGMLKMMLQTVPNILETESKDAAWINDFLEQLSLTSGRLDGFTDHLLTLHRGGHSIPTRNSLSRSFDKILSDDKAFDLFSGKDNCPKSAGGLDVTPYGSRHEGLSYRESRQLNAVTEKSRFFRPVTHCQARIRKFNIVDRF